MHYFQRGLFLGIIEKALSIGGTGVHIFFICSGFGLFMSYTRRRTNYLEFFKRRFFKVYIPYIIIVAIAVCLPYMISTNPLKTFLAHAFLYKMFSQVYEESIWTFWYISTLFQFYFLFIPLMKIKERIGSNKFLISGCVISIFWWLFTAFTGLSSQRIWGSFCFQYMWEFCFGIIIAERLINNGDIRIRRSILAILFIAGIGIASVLKMIGEPYEAFNDLFAVVGYGSFALLLYSLKNSIVCNIMNWISSISYEWYLTHILVFNTVKCFIGKTIVSSVIALPFSIIAAFIYKKICGIVLKDRALE